VGADLPSRFIVSRVIEAPNARESLPNTLSASRMEMLIQQRRMNRQANPAELPGLLLQPAVAASTSGTQATVNASR